MLKLNSSTFYKNHSLELKKFLNSNYETLHIIDGDENLESLFNESTILFAKNKSNLFENTKSNKSYDQLIMTNFIENSQDFLKNFIEYEKILKTENKLIISAINSKWNFMVTLLSKLKIIKSERPKNYITKKTVENTFKGLDYTLTKSYTRQIFPFKFFYLGTLFNIFLEILFFRFNLGLKSYFIFVKNQDSQNNIKSKTLIIPAKNEAGNLEELIERINLENKTQIIFVIAESKDDTFNVANNIAKSNKKYDFTVLEQKSNGKKNAVNEALPFAKNNLVAILDSDISVDPEELVNFFEIIEKNLADFVNGTRLIYSMESGAMRLLNNFGNRVFQKFVSFVIKENITDTLCGTKVFKKELIHNILEWDKSLKFKDPFGDFNFIFAASTIGERIVDYPIHYRSRTYGSPQISRFRDGYKLFLNFLNSIVKLNASKY